MFHKKRGRPTLRTKERPILETDYIPVTESGCWLWLGATCQGYGIVSKCEATGGKRKYAHRLSYEQFVGPIPEGLELDHKCRTRCCIRPDHLEPVTTTVNVLRGEGLAARHARKTHCANGHLLSGENVKIRIQRTNGRIHRDCVACDKFKLDSWHNDPVYRERMCRRKRERYHSDPVYREKVLTAKREYRARIRQQRRQLAAVAA